MSVDTSAAARSRAENWVAILELSVEEVFEIMLGGRAQPVPKDEHTTRREFTAMVGLAGALRGVLTVCCDTAAARHLAQCMLGDIADSEGQVSGALGEICNMVAGNFESGAAQMKAASQPAFDRIAEILRQRDYGLRIEGHTDSVPIHTAQYSSNWELSTARATEIIRLLIVRDGFAPDRLSAAGYAEFHPIATNATVAGRSMNRRVDVVILGREPPALPVGAEPRPAPTLRPVATQPNPASARVVPLQR